jgi:thiol:disulfide interchange protein
VALTVLITVLVSGRKAPTPPAFLGASHSLSAAVTEAAENHKLVFAVATADWCPACQAYKRGALADDRVAAWIGANAIPVYLDVTDGVTDDTRHLGINAIPASFIIDAQGKILASREGVAPASDLLSWLQKAAGTETASAKRD